MLAVLGRPLDGDVGYLASATTAQHLRGRGVQTTLIQHRCEVARRAGVSWLTSQTAFGPSSQRNLQRAGLQIASTATLWERPARR